ncbi:MAG TPA: hypothetical protein VFN74_02135 [Chloroflexota bacterium]|nr:hypothetical protein [Chloroflexota bacterium]
MGLFDWLKRVREDEGGKKKGRVWEAEDDTGWVRASLGGTWLNPDRDELEGEALMREAYKAYRYNPLAYAIIEQTTSFVLGGGAKVVAEDTRVQRVIDSFWHDHENNMPERIYAIQTELSLFGEQFIRFFVDPITARTLIRQMDPLYVTAIETHPEDREHSLRYLWAPPSAPLDPVAQVSGWWVPANEVLHVSVNKVAGAIRGRSDLAPVLPWLRRYTEWVDDRVVQNNLKTAFVWDVTLKGAGRSEINAARAASPTAPRRGSVLFHSDTESWQAVRPQIGADDAAADGRAIRLMIATGSMLPEHYLGEGGNANRATAAEMGLPAMKRFQRRQELFRAMLARIIDRVLEEGVNKGRLGPRVNRNFVVQFEELSAAPIEGLAAATERLTRALKMAEEQGWVSKEEAGRMWRRYAGQVDESAEQGGEVAAA